MPLRRQPPCNPMQTTLHLARDLIATPGQWDHPSKCNLLQGKRNATRRLELRNQAIPLQRHATSNAIRTATPLPPQPRALR